MFKVLWISHNPLPAFARQLGIAEAVSGGWIPALADLLVSEGAISLGVVSDIRAIRHGSHARIGGVENYAFPLRSSGDVVSLTPGIIAQFKHVISEFKPDVVHIHGTEAYYGLLSAERHINVPTVISIQGIIDYHRRHMDGGLSALEALKIRTLRDWLLLDGLFEQRIKWDKRSKMERRIFASNKCFIGRTVWDKAHLRRLNPTAAYFHCDEILRPVFLSRAWSLLNAKRFSIFVPSAEYPLKGFHVLLHAVAILKHDFPGLEVRVPLAYFKNERGVHGIYASLRGTGYSRYLSQLIRRYGLADNITVLGQLTAEQMADEYARAHVFVLPSLAENSPNSLAEAMTVGTPTVASFVGGVPSLINDGHDSLAFPAGDEALLAEQVRRIWADDAFANSLSYAARSVAGDRHSGPKVVARMLEIYKAVRSQAAL